MEERNNNSDECLTMPSVQAFEKELSRVEYKRRYRSTFHSSIRVLVVVAAIATLVATTIMPVFRTYGDSMTPTLNEGDVVVTLKGSSYETGDVVGLYVGNELLTLMMLKI